MNIPTRALHIIILLLVAAAVVARASEEPLFRIFNASNGLADNSAQVVTCTKTGRIIIATIGNINFYDGTSFTHADTRQAYQYHLPQYRGNYHIYFDNRHHLWLKNTGTITCLDLMRERFIANVDSVFVAMGCSDSPQDFFTDSIGTAWMVTDRGLLNSATGEAYPVLRDRNLQDLEVRDNTTLYTFYDNGEEMATSLATGAVLHRTKAYGWEKAQRYARSSVLFHHGDGFFQIRNGDRHSALLFFNTRTLEWTIITEQDYHLNNMAMLDGVLYVASEYGYWTYDTRNGELCHHERLQMIGSQEPIITNCNAIAFDRQGGMWIGTERRGVLYARPESSTFQALSWDNPKAGEYARLLDDIEQNIHDYDGKTANCMFIDSRGWAWVGTTTGLYLQRALNEPAELFDRHRGLLNNVVHSICEDRRHNIWLATSCGISCIIFNGGMEPVFVNSFNRNDNVPEETFSNCKARLLDDGTIIMQGVDHMVCFRPEDFDFVNIPKPTKLFPKLLRLTMNGDIVEAETEYDGNVIIDRAFSRVRDITLKSSQNSITLTFSSLNYFRTLQTFYRVRVGGLDNEWRVFSYYNSNGLVDSNGRLHLPLIGLHPGAYTVEVQAAMFPGEWDGRPFQWNVYVSESWWNSTGGYLATAIVIVLLLLVNFFLYSRNARMKERRAAEEGDVVKRIAAFVERCDAFEAEELAPVQEEVSGDGIAASEAPTAEFTAIMERLMPLIRRDRRSLSMRRLSEAAGVGIEHFYEVMTANLHKSPRPLVRQQRLSKAAKMLLTTENTVEQVAAECGFYTANYFIGNFFHEYKMTPGEYRQKKTQPNTK